MLSVYRFINCDYEVKLQGQILVTEAMGHLSMGSSSASIHRSIGHVQYVGVIQMIEGDGPPLTCREHMLKDLPRVLQSPKGTLAVKFPFIVEECECIAEDRLQRLPAGTPALGTCCCVLHL